MLPSKSQLKWVMTESIRPFDQKRNRIQRRARGDEQRFAVRAAETQVGGRFRHENLADQFSVRREDVDTVARARKNPALRVATNPVWPALVNHAEHLAALERAVALHVEHADVTRLAGVGDVELLLVRREA